MKKGQNMRKHAQVNGQVPLKNVAAFMAMVQRLQDRHPKLPGLGVCSGHSGLGKTEASIFAQNITNAVRVECLSRWTARDLMEALLRELKQEVKRNERIATMEARVIAAMGDDPTRPLFIDEADKMFDRGLIEIARELQEGSGAPVVLIGEEKLPTKLLTVEKVHNRVQTWFVAQPCDLEDTQQLARAFQPKLKIADDLLTKVVNLSQGRARRIVNALSDIGDFARNKNLADIDLAQFTGKIATGAPPAARPIDAYAQVA